MVASQWTMEEMPHAVVVRPKADIIRHTTTAVCPCAPVVEKIVYTCLEHREGMGMMALILQIVHQPMDGRKEDNSWRKLTI